MHWFIDPVTKQYADFEGRTDRESFWMYVLIYWIVFIVLSAINETTAGIFALAFLIPNLAITARRLHDVGKSGWWMLISFIPFLGAIILIVFCATKSDVGANAYGNSSSATNPNEIPPIPSPSQVNLEVPKPPADNA